MPPPPPAFASLRQLPIYPADAGDRSASAPVISSGWPHVTCFPRVKLFVEASFLRGGKLKGGWGFEVGGAFISFQTLNEWKPHLCKNGSRRENLRKTNWLSLLDDVTG